ncbi:ATP phosphoribosyltransferase [Candidatus Bathyarchaeota archaeon]|nr:ATP phosphoribosyltransferase [Candidatus Bathyarchaeota archaeon]
MENEKKGKTQERKLKLALPKGSLWSTTEALLQTAGYRLSGGSRGYRPSINDDDIEVKMLRPQEIPNYLIGEDEFDIGITGMDWVKETGADVEVLLDLNMGKVKIVFAIPDEWEGINSFDDCLQRFIDAGKPFRISTEYINLSLDFITGSKVYQAAFGDLKPRVITPWITYGDNDQVVIYLSFGATEAKPPEEVDAIIDNTETGSTLRANNLRIVEIIDRSSALLVGNKTSLADPWKDEKSKDIMTLLQGVVDARQKLHVFMNVKDENLPKLLDHLEALKKPTISKLTGDGSKGWSAINTIIPRADFLKMIPMLRKYAQGLVVYEPRQVLPLERFKNESC